MTVETSRGEMIVVMGAEDAAESETVIVRIETGESGIAAVEDAVTQSHEASEEIGVNAPESNERLAWNAMFVRNAKAAGTEKVEASV